ncbi:hypothetical protein TIFTF001_032046 [Ficus carica]|uniref:Uncharacterized protein n=1 Tax=Ficus carica TaxID=3494 RepID=A0AA88E2N3_FICCA|nr:hypothetical protein TIFTF001_032046 [Ficus carica]
MSIKAPKEESKKLEAGCSALNIHCSALKGRELDFASCNIQKARCSPPLPCSRCAAVHKKPAAVRLLKP